MAWHPLKAHCADVAAVTEALLEKSILQSRLDALGQKSWLNDANRARLCVLAALHDVGKTNHGFQRRAEPECTEEVGHVSPFVSTLFGTNELQKKFLDALAVPEKLGWFGSQELLSNFLLATFSHHGSPTHPGAPPPCSLWRPSAGRDPLAEIERIHEAARGWFPAAFESDAPALPEKPELQHAFNGLLTLADWIGSDERFFPYASNGSDRIEDARRFAGEALDKLGLDPAPERHSLGYDRPGFQSVCDFSPRPIQSICTELEDHAEGSLTILEAETGSGKTEAALARFAQLFHADLVDGMYFALPTRTAATQIHERVVEAMKNAFPAADFRPPVVLAVPGYLRVDEATGERLPGFEVRWDEDGPQWNYRGWAAESRKRYLAGTVAVGTIDQVLLSTLQVRHAHMRAAALMRQFLVVDEVHASDPYMTRLLEEVLDHHLECGGHAFLMSATLGSSTQARLLDDASTEGTSAEDAAAMDYPMVTHADARCEELQRLGSEPASRSKAVRMEDRTAADHPADVAGEALKAARDGARVLVIRNTVSDCIRTQLALEEVAGADEPVLFRAEDVIAPHHSRYTGSDRKKLDRCLEADFGKGSDREGVVVVATQSVEQSLDIDADLMLTDLCPADVLLQRLGRLHRHRNERPPGSRPDGYRRPWAVVLVPDERDLGPHISGSGKYEGKAFGPHGLGTVYEDLRTLEATWRLVDERETWTIPDMNRELVEAATHSETLRQLTDELGGEWPRHQQWLDGMRTAQKSHAGLVLLPRDKPFEDVKFPHDLNEHIKTRLGEGDRRVELASAVQSPFGATFDELTLPAHYVPEGDEAATAENIDANGGTLRFDFAGDTFIYDRLGLHPAGASYREDTEHDE